MRSLCATLLAGIVSTLAVGCGKTGGGASLDGTYVIVETEVLGKKLPEPELTRKTEANRTFVFRGDQMIAMKDGKEEAGTFKTDTSKSPAHIDIIAPKGDGPEKMFGIYKLEGDTLTICVGITDKPEGRPKEFQSTQDAPAMIMVMKKKK